MTIEESIKNIDQAITLCEEDFRKDRINKENCIRYKNVLMDKILPDVQNLRAALDFENRMFDFFTDDNSDAKLKSKHQILDMASEGKIEFRLSQQDIAILEGLYRVTKAIYGYGNAYFKLSPNSTSFLEDNFGKDADLILEKVFISPEMKKFIYGVHESWHWHGW
jgi:hypothetical protein